MKSKHTDRISEHARGIGTVTTEMIEQRARELALIDGRSIKKVRRNV